MLTARKRYRESLRDLRADRDRMFEVAADLHTARGAKAPAERIVQLEKELDEIGVRLIHSQQIVMYAETIPLMDQARRLGLEVPSSKEKPSWWDNYYYEFLPEGSRSSDFLSETGKNALRKAIRDERRKNAEWWVNIVYPLLTTVVAILGLIVASVSLSSK